MRVVPSRGVTGGSAPRVRTGTSLKGKGDSSGPSIRSATLNLRCKLLKTLKKERLNPNIIVLETARAGFQAQAVSGLPLMTRGRRESRERKPSAIRVLFAISRKTPQA